MNKLEIRYKVIGSSALRPNYEEKIIEFPFYKNNVELKLHKKRNILHKIVHAMNLAFEKSVFFQDLKYGSIQGKPFNKAKPWQSILAGTCFFAIAIACIYFCR